QRIAVGAAFHAGFLPGAAIAAGSALEIDEDIAAAGVESQPAVAARTPATNLVGAAALEAERQPVRAEEVARGAEAAIHANSLWMIRHHDHGRDILRRSGCTVEGECDRKGRQQA